MGKSRLDNIDAKLFQLAAYIQLLAYSKRASSGLLTIS